MDMDWYVVYTKPGSEQKMSETLKRKKFEHYCQLTVYQKMEISGKQKKHLCLKVSYL